MVERQPGRPTQQEVDGAVSRLRSDDYWVSEDDAAAQIAGACISPLGFTAGSHIMRMMQMAQPYYDDARRKADHKIVRRERMAEEPNLTESEQDFIERRARGTEFWET